MFELYKIDFDGKLNKEIDNEGISFDKMKFFYKIVDESEYMKKIFCLFWLVMGVSF